MRAYHPPTSGGKHYVFVLIDNFCRYMWTMFLKEKSEAFEKFKTLKNLQNKKQEKWWERFEWTDRRGEFVSHEFRAYCKNNGINRHLTAPYFPQHNGVVECRYRTLLEMTRSMLKHMSVPNSLWGEVVRHATYLINRVATRSLLGQTPYEALRNKRPSLGHFRVFWMCLLSENRGCR